MSFSTRFFFDKAQIDFTKQQIFAPILGAYIEHSVDLRINQIFYPRGFSQNGIWLELDTAALGFSLDKDDEVGIQIEYFFKSSHDRLLGFLVRRHYAADTREKTVEIMSDHYIDGNFAFDNGLHREAVMNFGTVLESILDLELNGEKSLNDFIKAEKTATSQIKSDMNEIRKARNSVHPSRLKTSAKVSRMDAQRVREALHRVMFHYLRNDVTY